MRACEETAGCCTINSEVNAVGNSKLLDENRQDVGKKANTIVKIIGRT